MRKIVEVKANTDLTLSLVFDNGVCGVVDVSHLKGKGLFKVWADPSVFASVRIGEDGELLWGNDIGLCPDALYIKITGKDDVSCSDVNIGEKAHA